MPPRVPRPTLPDDDLYARLGVPIDASPEAIDLAWRGLLRKHHPDVAGPGGLDLAKRINVAHDWLADPAMRARYDEERSIGGRDPRRPGGGVARSTAWASGESIRADRAPRRPRPASTADRVAAIVERVGRLGRDELDRLALAEPAPIAFLATLRRFLGADQMAALDAAERAVLDALPPAARRVPGIRDAVVGRVAEPILADTLDELLGDPAGDRAKERLTRGWDAAVGQPRYGPATTTVEALLARVRSLSVEESRWLSATGARDRLGEPPWPEATSRDEDEALRVSTELAAEDIEAAIRDAGGNAGARRAGARIAHLLVLRHAFAASAFDRHAAPWLGTLIERTMAAEPRVRYRA
ncbi:MAG: DnaJ domain-containing protein [Candidatus Limnocylindrales bacterium]